jgi:hypothetical protein
MPRSDAMRFSAVPSVCADRIDATTATVTPWQRIQTRVAPCIAVRNPSAVASKATRRTPTAPTNWPALFLPSQRGQPQQTPKSTRSHLVGHALWPRSNCRVRHAYSERGGGLGEHSLAGGWEAPTARLARQRLPVRGADFNDAPRIDGTNTESVGAVSVSFDSPPPSHLRCDPRLCGPTPSPAAAAQIPARRRL